MSAAVASINEREQFLKEADTYLMEGLIDLYSDINAQIKSLADIKGPFASIKEIDTILSYINEDMLMIPKYVGMRLYLFNYRGKTSEAKRILGEYKYQIKVLSDRKLADDKYTALELIHKNYPYNNENLDFWLESPVQMLEAIESYGTLLEQNDKDIYYIAEESNE